MSGTYKAFLPKGFETINETKLRTNRLALIVSELSPTLCSRLRNCSAKNPCNSGACPKCLRRFRVWLLKHGLQIIERGGPPAGGDPSKNTRYWTAASIITHSLTAPIGGLSELEDRGNS